MVDSEAQGGVSLPYENARQRDGRRFLLRVPCLLPLLASLAAIWGGQWWTLAIAACALAYTLHQRRILLMLLLCVLCVMLRMHRQQGYERYYETLLQQEQSLTLRGTVTRVLAHGCVVDSGFGGTRVLFRGDTPFREGDEVIISGVSRTAKPPLVPGMFDASRWRKGQGIAAEVDYVRGEYLGHPFSWASFCGYSRYVRDILGRRLMPVGTEDDPRRQVLCALILGDKSVADSETMLPFQRGGCMHAFAVSGLHVGLVAAFLWGFARLFRLHPAWARPLILFCLAAYVWVTGMAPPAMRAFLMLAALMGALALKKQSHLLNVWCFTALLLLLLQPWQLYNSGFLLSFAVYAAICVGVRAARRDSPWFGPDSYIPFRIMTSTELRWKAAEAWLRGLVVVSLCAWLVSLPLGISFFHAFNTYGLFTNVAIAPLLPVVMGTGLLSLCCSGVPVLTWLLDAAAVHASGCLIATVSFFAGLPMAYLPAQEPAEPSSGIVLNLSFGNSVCLLGNPGVLIDCGRAEDVQYTLQPLLFHSGMTPAAMVVTSSNRSKSGGKGTLRSYWPDLLILEHDASCAKHELKTDAGLFRIYSPPLDLPLSPAANEGPVIVWESPEGLVVYLGDASAATLDAVDADLSAAVLVVLGHNPTLPINSAGLMDRCPRADVILLPSAQRAGKRTGDFAPLHVRCVNEETPLLNLRP